METPETRTSDYVCVDCGQQYLTRKQRIEANIDISLFSKDKCGLCGDKKPVTNIRAYNHLQKPKQ